MKTERDFIVKFAQLPKMDLIIKGTQSIIREVPRSKLSKKLVLQRLLGQAPVLGHPHNATLD